MCFVRKQLVMQPELKNDGVCTGLPSNMATLYRQQDETDMLHVFSLSF